MTKWHKHAISIVTVLSILALFSYGLPELSVAAEPDSVVKPTDSQVLSSEIMNVKLPVITPRFKGSWQQGSILYGKTQPKAVVRIDGKSVRVTADGDFIVALSRDHKAFMIIELALGTQVEQHRFTVTKRQYALQKIEGVPSRTVTPPTEVSDRVIREAALVRAARANSSDNVDFLQGFKKPLQGIITGVYGSQRYYNGVPKNPHYGLDIAAPTGTLVAAPASGVVTLAQPDLYFSGGTLIVDHGYGLFSTFIHLSDILVAVGDRVKVGDNIAKVGATGRATGPHLDWRINWFAVRVDPALALKHFPYDKK